MTVAVDDTIDSLRVLNADVASLVGRRRAAVSQAAELAARRDAAAEGRDTWARAQELLRTFADEQSSKLRSDIERIVSHGLRSVFGEELTFRVTTRILRGTAAVEFSLVDGQGVERPIVGSHGGGLAQVVGFVLRVVVVMLSPNRKLLVLDEPFSMVSAEYRPRLARFVRELADSTDLHLLVVTHDPDLPEVATSLHRITLRDGVSHATLVPLEASL